MEAGSVWPLVEKDEKLAALSKNPCSGSQDKTNSIATKKVLNLWLAM
jgi:hypothetical protein